MVGKIRTRLRNLIQDNSKSSSESFTWTSGTTLTLATENASTVTNVTINGASTSAYTYNSTSQVLTFTTAPSSGDVVVVYFTYNKYSNSELLGYINSALYYLSVYQYNPYFEIASGDNEVFPIPNLKEISLIAVVASILIKPSWNSYRTATVTIYYPRTKSKDDKIREIISYAKRSSGIIGIISL